MSISFFWVESGWWMGFESIDQPGWSSEVQCNTKMRISFFWLEMGGGWGLSPLTSPANHQKLNVIQKWAFHYFRWRLVADGVWVQQPAWLIIRSEHNPKRSISFYWLERGGKWGLSPLTSLANHQKLYVIQKWAFHFFGWRGVVDGVWVHWQHGQSSEVEHNQNMSMSFFGWRQVVDGVRVH